MRSLPKIEPFQDLIVLTLWQEKYEWFITPKEYWIMDYVKLSAAFGHDDSHYRDRLFIPVLDQHTFPTLKDKIRDLGVSTSTLHQLIMEQLPLLNWEDYGHLFPALFVDFDQSKLYSTYQEVTNFEEYVPEGWDGIYTNFYYLIPVQKQYWIIAGTDHFKILLQ